MYNHEYNYCPHCGAHLRPFTFEPNPYQPGTPYYPKYWPEYICTTSSEKKDKK